jgi:hypothetical protein
MTWLEEDRAYWRAERRREFFDSAGWVFVMVASFVVLAVASGFVSARIMRDNEVCTITIPATPNIDQMPMTPPPRRPNI